MRISYAITVKDELAEIAALIDFLDTHKRSQDQIVVLMDSRGPDSVWEYLDRTQRGFDLRSNNQAGHMAIVKGTFNNDFAEWKNKLNELCYGEYIFNIDADEMPHEYIVTNLPRLLSENPSVDMFMVPRINTVSGLTQEHIGKWGWRVDEKGWINFPDYQSRIYKNDSSIRWDGRVHETIVGVKTWAALPAEEQWCLYHSKTIERQEKQNNFYNTI